MAQQEAHLYIFDLTETLVAVLDPNDVVGPYYEAYHLEQLNSENSLHFQLPANNEKSEQVIEGNLVAFKDLDGDFQLFEIKRIEEIHSDVIIKDVFCENAVFELLDELVLFQWDRNKSASTILTNALTNTVSGPTRWSAGTVTVTGTATVRMEINSPIEVFQKMITAFGGGEFKYRVTISGNSITGRFVDFLTRRGSDTGKRFEYEKDLNFISREIDASDVKTALYGFGKAEEVPGGIRRKRFSEIVWTTPSDPRNKPLGQEYIEDNTAKAQWGRAGGTRHRWGFFEDPDELDPQQLILKTNELLDQLIQPQISYEMKVVDLERIAGFDHEKVRLGDGVIVIDRTFRPELFVEARVIELKRFLTEPERDEVVLGRFRPLVIQDGLTLRDLQDRVHNKEGVWTDSAFKSNLITDHSFENIPRAIGGGSPDADQVYNVLKTVPDYGSPLWWQFNGTGKVISTYDTTTLLNFPQLALYDYQAAVISSVSEPFQFVPISKALGINGPYTVSVYMAAFAQTTTDGEAQLLVYANDNTFTRLNGGAPVGISRQFILSSEKDVWKRTILTLSDTLPVGTQYLEVWITGDFTTYPTLSYLADGVQLVAMDKPQNYDPESNLWKMLKNFPGTKLQFPVIQGDVLVENGWVTQENPDYVRTYQTVIQPIPGSTFTKIIFDTLPIDVRGTFNLGLSRFVAPAKGFYLVTSSIRLSAPLDTQLSILNVYINGANHEKIDAKSASGSLDYQLSGSTVISLNAGDFVEIYVWSSAAINTRVGSQETHFKIYKIG